MERVSSGPRTRVVSSAASVSRWPQSSMIDAAVRTRFLVRQLKMLIQLCQWARHVELDGVAGEEVQAQRGIIPGCVFATTLLQVLVVGRCGRCGGRTQIVSIRVVVGDLSLQRFGDHNRFREQLHGSQAHAGRVRSSHDAFQSLQQISLRAGKAAVAAGAPRRAGNKGRSEPRNRLCVRKASVHIGDFERDWKNERVC